jgi:CubicO group peptidase (beta-lactamase class C family)
VVLQHTAYTKLIAVLASVTHKEPNEVTTELLTRPLAMRDTTWVSRQNARASANAYALATTARDIAKVGLLVLSGGAWDRQRIVSESYVREMVQPSQSLNPSYGLLWFSNRRVPQNVTPKLDIASAPPDLIAAFGFAHRRLWVWPSQRLVVVRLGDPAPTLDTPPEELRFDSELWTKLLDAAPKRH